MSFTINGQPNVVPTIYVRISKSIYLHVPRQPDVAGPARGEEVCVAVTIVDGLVLARSASIIRSIIVRWSSSEPAREVASRIEKPRCCGAVRSSDTGPLGRCPPTQALTNCGRPWWCRSRFRKPRRRSAPVHRWMMSRITNCRSGPGPPLRLAAGSPIDDPRVKPGIEPPLHATDYRGPK